MESEFKNVKPSAHYVLMEFIESRKAERKTKSGIILVADPLKDTKTTDKMRAIIKSWGNKVDPEEWGFKEGDCAIFIEGMAKTYKMFDEAKGGDYYVALILPRDIVGFYDPKDVIDSPELNDVIDA